MSTDTPAILTDPLTDSTSSRLALGAAFRAARKRQGMEIDVAAHQLRMSPRQLLALEEDNLEALVSPAFVRGFIRNYARLLHLDAEPLLEAHRAMLPSDAHRGAISLHSEHIAFSDGSRKAWMAYVLASCLVVALGGGWMFYKDWSAKQPQKTAVVEQPKTVEPEPQKVEPVLATAAPVQAQAIEMPSATPSPASNPVVVATPPASPAISVADAIVKPEPSNAPIRMVFSEETWVSVTDSTGKQVLNKTSPAGAEEMVDGVPPFRVIIGNAKGAKLFYKSLPYDVESHTKSNVARLKLE